MIWFYGLLCLDVIIFIGIVTYKNWKSEQEAERLIKEYGEISKRFMMIEIYRDKD